MRAVQLTRFGPPLEVIELVEQPPEAPRPGQALVEVLATPINPSDTLTLAGLYGALPKLPVVPGNEGVGRVLEVNGAPSPRVGDLVFLPLGSGTWRQRLVAPSSELLPVPAGTDLLQASMLFINPPTADLMLRQFVSLQPGDWVLQNAANSAVGRYLISLAKQAGYRTLNVVRRESLAPELKALGADVVLVDGEDLPRRVREATGGAKVRLGIDAVGGLSTQWLGDSLASGGVLVNYGLMSGEGPRLSPGAAVFKNITLRGFWLARWLREAAREEQLATYQRLAGLMTQGTLAAAVDATFPLERIHDAVARALEGGRQGKVLLTPNPVA